MLHPSRKWSRLPGRAARPGEVAVSEFATVLGPMLGLALGLGCSSGGYSAPPTPATPGSPTPSGLALTAVRPGRVPSSGGTQLTLQGLHFTARAVVTIADQPAQLVEWKSETELVVTVPPSRGAVGLVPVTVSTGPADRVTRSDLLAYYPSTLSFATPRSFNVDAKPTGLLLCDLNGDGKLDVVTANLSAASLSVLLGKGDGTFQPAQSVSVGSRPYALRAGDMNGDGKLDLVVARDSTQGVTTLLGKGDGTFQTARDLNVALGSYTLALADLNGDGKLDLVAPGSSSLGSGSLYVALGKGDGTFQSATGNSISSVAYGMAVADWNGDKKLDVAVAEYENNAVSIYLGQGNGRLMTSRSISVGSAPMGMLATDLNGDGKADLVVTNGGGTTLSQLLGQGDGTFQAMQATSSGGMGPRPIVLDDVNIDGTPDLVLVNVGSGTTGGMLSVLLGTGAGKHQAPQSFATPGQSVDLAVADLNGDQLPDAILPSSSTASVNVFLNVSK